MVDTPPAWRMRTIVPAWRSPDSGVSKMVLDSKTRGRDTRKPAARRKRRAVLASGTASLISVSCALLGMELLGAVALMVVEEILVNGLTAAESFVHRVPERDTGFAEFPTKVDFHAAEQRGEIDQADI